MLHPVHSYPNEAGRPRGIGCLRCAAPLLAPRSGVLDHSILMQNLVDSFSDKKVTQGFAARRDAAQMLTLPRASSHRTVR